MHPKTFKKAKTQAGLNPSQQKAIQFENGALLVVAGAGTGKTRVITERIKYLIEEKNVRPEEILALTFTEKASKEMLERVDDVMPLGYLEPYIYTFHSFADRILKAEGLEIGIDTSYKILNGTNQWLFFRKNLFKFGLEYFKPLGNPTKFISAILKFISRLQDENISEETLTNYAKTFSGEELEKQKWQELAQTYKKYQELKISGKKAQLDFGDLINYLIKLFAKRPNILKKYQKQFKHILVDEFQDTNYAQYELIKMLFPNTKTKRSLLVVGDDSQSIYKFRGAAVSNIMQFMSDYPSAEMISLTQNYRSSQAILDASYNVVQNNNPDTLESKLGISKKLTAVSKEKSIKPQVILTQTSEDEVETVIAQILDILAKEPNLTYKDIAILARANSHLDPFILALKKYELPYQLVGNRGLYDQEEIRNLIALLKIIVDPTDPVTLYRALNIVCFEIPHAVISEMLSLAKLKRTPFWEVIAESKQPSVVKFCAKILGLAKKITKSTPTELVYELIYSTGYIENFTREETVENNLRLKNLDLFYNIVKSFEIEFRQDQRENPNIINFTEYLEMMLEAGDNPAQAEIEDIDTINLLTVHAAKGLEFSVVFMVNLVSDRFPTRDRSDSIEIPDEFIKEALPEGDPHIQEERRLFYVGMTRAKKYLFMTLAKNYGGKRDKTPSGFVSETGLKIFESSADLLKPKTDQSGLFGIDTAFREPSIEKSAGYMPSFVSYTQLSTYETCGLKYKYNYILKIPTPPNHALTFGDTIHKTLKEFHTQLLFNDKLTLDDLLKIYQDNWDPNGYISEEHKNERFEDGKKILAKYFEKNKKTKVTPKALEQSFNLNIAGTRLYGKIDRVDPLPSGGVEIIDYKTGKSRDQKDVDKDEQLTIYAIGAKESLKMNPEKLSLYFVESGEKVTTSRTDQQISDEKEKVADLVGKIKSGNFTATPGMHCGFCDYKDICPFAFRG